VSEESQVKLLEKIAILNDILRDIQSRFDRGLIKGPEAALKLQRLKKERSVLRGQLDPLELAWSHPFPDKLPPKEKRSRNEVRALMGLPPLADNEDL